MKSPADFASAIRFEFFTDTPSASFTAPSLFTSSGFPSALIDTAFTPMNWRFHGPIPSA